MYLPVTILLDQIDSKDTEKRGLKSNWFP